MDVTHDDSTPPWGRCDNAEAFPRYLSPASWSNLSSPTLEAFDRPLSCKSRWPKCVPCDFMLLLLWILYRSDINRPSLFSTLCVLFIVYLHVDLEEHHYTLTHADTHTHAYKHAHACAHARTHARTCPQVCLE